MSGQLLLFANIPLTPFQQAMADRTAKANRQRLEKEAYLAQAARDFQSLKRRRDLRILHRTTSQKAADASARAHRNLKMLKRESKLCAAACFLTMTVPSSSQWVNPEVLSLVTSRLVTLLRYNPSLQ